MSHKWLCRLAGVGVVLLGAMALPQASFAQLEVFQQQGTNSDCSPFTGSTGTIPTVNLEGRTEEGADVVIEAESTSSFTVGHRILVTVMNGVDLTAPVVANGGNLPVPNFVVCDGAGGALAISQPVVNRSFTVLGVQVTISFNITSTNTSCVDLGCVPGVVLRNLRWDVTSIGDDTTFFATAADCNTTTDPTCAAPTAIPLAGDESVSSLSSSLDLGTAGETIESSFDIDAVTSSSGGGFGFQNANGGMVDQTFLGFAEGFFGALRAALPAGTLPGDIATNATTVEFQAGDLTTIPPSPIPSGVTVTFPSQFLVDPLDNALLLGSPTGTCSGTGGTLDCTYQTINSDTDFTDDSAFTVANGTQIQTGASAGANTIVVNIAASSGSGLVPLTVSFGPDEVASPAAIPRYMTGLGCTSGEADCGPNTGMQGRGIIEDTFFTISPTKTNMIVPWVTNLFGFDSGISVSNTGVDDFGPFTCPTPPCTAFSLALGGPGPVTVTLFPDDGTAPIVFTTGPGMTPGRGLAANGTLAPGATWAVDLNSLLVAAGFPAGTTKEGYMLIQTGFTYGHAAIFVFTPSFGFSGSPVFTLEENFARTGAFLSGAPPFALPEPQGQVVRRKKGGGN